VAALPLWKKERKSASGDERGKDKRLVCEAIYISRAKASERG
jgi:hypothetical protein